MEVAIRGGTLIIDDEDLTSLEKYKSWHVNKNGYAVHTTKDGGILFHREIMRCPNGLLVNHRNTNRLDCRKENLRICTRLENSRNASLKRTNNTGYKGVSFETSRGKYRALIKVNYKQVFLGYYNTPEEAHTAYCKASLEYHGEYGRTS